MEALQIVLEDEGIQALIDENSEAIMKSSDILVQFADVIKEEVMENLGQFIEPGDLATTHENIRIYTEHAVASYANTLSDELAQSV
jgi:hypothetical protein